MDALTAIAVRHSSRQFNGKPVSKDALEKIVDAGRLAPTARNEQPWDFIVVTQPEQLKQLADFTDYGKFIAQAGACIAVVSKDTKYYLEDGCAATAAMFVAASSLGIASCWVAGDKKPYAGRMVQFLGAPAGYKLVSLVVLGYEDDTPARAKKRALKDVLHWEQW
jgi:nitroreductase